MATLYTNVIPKHCYLHLSLPEEVYLVFMTTVLFLLSMFYWFSKRKYFPQTFILDNVYVIEEYAPYGSLLTFLRTQRSLSQSTESLDQLPPEDRVDAKTLLSFSWQIASGMDHLANLQVGRCVRYQIKVRQIFFSTFFILAPPL